MIGLIRDLCITRTTRVPTHIRRRRARSRSNRISSADESGIVFAADGDALLRRLENASVWFPALTEGQRGRVVRRATSRAAPRVVLGRESSSAAGVSLASWRGNSTQFWPAAEDGVRRAREVILTREGQGVRRACEHSTAREIGGGAWGAPGVGGTRAGGLVSRARCLPDVSDGGSDRRMERSLGAREPSASPSMPTRHHRTVSRR